MTAEVVPQILDAIEFWGVRRQRDQRDVGGQLQIVSAMEAGSVPDQGRVDVGGQSAGELVEELIDDRRVQDGRENRLGLTGLRTRGPDDSDGLAQISCRRRHAAIFGDPYATAITESFAESLVRREGGEPFGLRLALLSQ